MPQTDLTEPIVLGDVPHDLRGRAAQMLVAAAPSSTLTLSDARIVVEVMRPVFAAVGTVVMQEGERADTEYMALVLEGEVRAESGIDVAAEEVVISVIGAGGLIGEMGVLDGGPRSATCTAMTDLKLAVLPRAALFGLIDNHPAVATRFLLTISAVLAERLRETNRRLRTVSQVGRELQREFDSQHRALDAAHSVNRKLLGDQRR